METDRKRFIVSNRGIVVIAKGMEFPRPKREPLGIRKIIDYEESLGAVSLRVQ